MTSDTTDEGNPDLSLTFYGDDLTGSTDVMESLAMNGMRTVLFFEPPAEKDLEAFGDVDAIGVAGTSRSMTPAEMDEALPPVFEQLRQFDSELCHYKVCSTFDSAPDVGSIGHAIDLGTEVFASSPVPIVVAAPDLHPRGRYVAFGNLFATVDGETYRLDRHPTMKDHPVTPMGEADLREHLAEQTTKNIDIVDLLDLEGGTGSPRDAFTATREDAELVFFDTVTEEHQLTVGELVWEYCASRPETVFAVGSSGLEYAITDHLQETGDLDDDRANETLPRKVPTVVVSGSASPVTAEQIDWALDHGFDGYRLDSSRLIDDAVAEDERRAAVQAALDSIDAGRSVVLYSARGPDDESIAETERSASELGIEETAVGSRLGREQGAILRDVLERTTVDRVCVAGGDTSGYVAPALDVYALELLTPLAPGGPLCRASSEDDRFDRLEIALKGGQVGQADYFGLVRDGGELAGVE
jgi:uncharacterized protein YgbK (DUF1537 family)